MKIKTSGLGLIALGILLLGAEASSYAVVSKRSAGTYSRASTPQSRNPKD